MMSSVIRLFSVSLTAVFMCVMAFAARAQETVEAMEQSAAEHHSESGGLPQLDAATFPNQLFWLVVTGVILYLLMAKVALPRVQTIMRARDEFVHEHLRKAAALRVQSEGAKVNYDVTIRDAETNAKEVLANTVAEMKQKHDAATQKLLADITVRTQAAEQRVQAEKDKIMATLDDTASRLANEIMLSVFETKPAKL
jgi:F-type H+-transporting ATPase subunit b